MTAATTTVVRAAIEAGFGDFGLGQLVTVSGMMVGAQFSE